jgi:Flp pilus assembly protein TadG
MEARTGMMAPSLRLLAIPSAMPMPTARRSRWFPRWSDRAGAMMLEFALLAPVLLMLVFGVIQIALLLFTQNALEIATHNTARLIRTGQIRAGDSATFGANLCAYFNSGLLNCGDLVWNVRSASTFAALTGSVLTAPPASSTFAPGSSGSAVLVQVFYKETLVIPFISATVFNGSVNLSALAALRTEAY